MKIELLRWLKPRRIGAHIKLIAVLPTALMALVFTWNTISERRHDAVTALRRETQVLAQLVGDGAKTALLSANPAYVEPLAQSVLARPEVVFLEIKFANGETLFKHEKSITVHSNIYSEERQLFQASIPIDPLADTAGDESAPKNSRLMGSLKIVASDAQLRVFLKNKLIEDISIGITITLIVLIGSTAISHSLTQRLQHTSAAVRDIAQGKQSRIETGGNDEVAELGTNINSMLDNLLDARRELENHLRELVAARDDADRANAEKHAFLGQISNEITAPLQRIGAHLDTLSETLAGTEHMDSVDDARYHIDLLHGLYEDLLEFYLQNTNRSSLHKRYFNIVETLDRIVQSNFAAAQQKSIALTAEYSGHEELRNGFIYSDSIRLRQIIQELISNALRYTFDGYVSVHAHFREIAANRVNVTIEVRDSGIGIPLDRQPLLFEVLQGHTPYDTAFSDTTGLLIAGRTANTLGASLTLRSRPGEGAVFTFEITGEFSASRNDHEEVTAPKQSAITVLFVSSPRAARRGVAELLGLSLNVDLVMGQDKGLASYLSKPYDIVLLGSLDDDSMFSLARNIREASAKLTPIIMIVEHLTPARLASADAIGINHIIAPPLRRYDLYKKIVQCTKMQGAFDALFNAKGSDTLS